MSPRTRAPVAAALLAVLSAVGLGCAPQWLSKPAAPAFDPGRLDRREFLAMGTHITVTLYRPPDRSAAQAAAALDDVEAYLHAFGNAWWAWGDGALGAMNRALAAGQPVTIPAAMQPLFARAAAISADSGGLFEPRIGALVRLWGFDDVTRLADRPPAAADIGRVLAALRAAPRYAGGGRYGPARGVAWDFGAIAKGYSVDAALERLQAAGFGDAIVDAGGNLATRGRKGGRPWQIAIRHPRASEAMPYLAALDTGDEAVNTHGDYERYIDYQGRRYGHILDPRTGYPADSLIAVTVVDRDGTLADAGGAALFVAGAGHWRELARRLHLDQVLVVDRNGNVQATAALARRLRPERGVTISTVP